MNPSQRSVHPPNAPYSRVRKLGSLIGLITITALGIASTASGQLSLAKSSQLTQTYENANFGLAIASGDINGDGLDDLAIGMPTREGNWGEADSGGVMIALGADGQWTTRILVGCGGHDGEAVREMGRAVAVGHLDDDPYADVVVSLPGATVNGQLRAGLVCVIHGAANLADIDPASAQVLSQDVLVGTPHALDYFGASLAIGDLDNDGWNDLAIGSTGEDVWFDWVQYDSAGAVNAVFGSPGGLVTTDNVVLTLGGNPFVPIENDANYGEALAIGRVSGVDEQGIYVGVPTADFGASYNAGAVLATIFAGRVPSTEVVLRQGLAGTAGTPGTSELFGHSLVLADFNGDDIEDLAVGVPLESGLGTDNGGAVNILLGNELAVHGGPDQILFEGLIDPATQPNESFGKHIAAGDFNSDGFADLAVAAPRDNSLGVEFAGEVTVFYGTPTGLTVDGHQIANMWFFGGLEPHDVFGAGLAAGNFFEANGGSDLAVGVPGRQTADGAVGIVQVIQSAILFTDDFETGDATTWSASVE